MNIFASSSCPAKSAASLDNKRVVKMILESSQMLSTALALSGVKNTPCKPAFENHPCSIWTRESRENYTWLLNHFEQLLKEYESRYGKIHLHAQYVKFYDENKDRIKRGKLTKFANATPFKSIEDVVLAYRLCLVNKWENLDKRKAVWPFDEKPLWYDSTKNILIKIME